MDSTSLCDRRSPSSDRFLGLFSFSLPSSAAGEELNEAEVFWTTTDDFAEPEETTNNHRLTFTRPQKSGILAVLPEPDRPAQVLYRRPSLSNPSNSKPIPSIPRPSLQSQTSSDGGQTQSVPSTRRFQQHSAPMKVPVLSKAMMMERRRNLGELADVVDDDDDGGDEEMLPPHELVARGSEVSARTTFSVLEGVGRTLKGRDLRQVRNAIWRKTGFLD